MRILHLASSLGPTASAKFVASAAPHLGVEQLVVNLDESRPFAKPLRIAGVPVEDIAFRGPFDLAAAVRLRTSVQKFEPSIVHVWGNRAAAIANALTGSHASKFSLVVGDLRTGSSLAYPLVERTRWRSVARRDSTPVAESQSISITASLGLPTGSQIILNAGGFDERSDQHAAVWAFDMLRYADPTLHLVLAGDGPQRTRVEKFAKSIARDDCRMIFPGIRSDIPGLLGEAALALISHRAGGTAFAAEALAAGKPVVAVDSAAMRSIVRPGENGFLAKRGDISGLASAVQRILTNDELAENLRAGARRTQISTAERAAAELLAIYRALAG